MLVLIRGAGDLATGVALRLWRSGMKVVLTDLPSPLAIRRTVAFSEAIRLREQTVEGVTAKKAENAEDAKRLLREGVVPVLADPELACRFDLNPDAVVDAILAKKNLGTRLDFAPVVVALGPGFTAGEDCHAVVETMRGHDLGRVILRGSALPNTAIPGLIGGYAGERVLRAPADGVLHTTAEIGTRVEAGESVGTVGGAPMRATIAGVLRGLLPDGTPVKQGLKAGDVDPRGETAYCHTVSDKALAVGGGVLEAILRLSGALEEKP